eukprot:7391846-Prymnesium_polylepis.1
MLPHHHWRVASTRAQHAHQQHPLVLPHHGDAITRGDGQPLHLTADGGRLVAMTDHTRGTRRRDTSSVRARIAAQLTRNNTVHAQRRQDGTAAATARPCHLLRAHLKLPPPATKQVGALLRKEARHGQVHPATTHAREGSLARRQDGRVTLERQDGDPVHCLAELALLVSIVIHDLDGTAIQVVFGCTRLSPLLRVLRDLLALRAMQRVRAGGASAHVYDGGHPLDRQQVVRQTGSQQLQGWRKQGPVKAMNPAAHVEEEHVEAAPSLSHTEQRALGATQLRSRGRAVDGVHHQARSEGVGESIPAHALQLALALQPPPALGEPVQLDILGRRHKHVHGCREERLDEGDQLERAAETCLHQQRLRRRPRGCQSHTQLRRNVRSARGGFVESEHQCVRLEVDDGLEPIT